MNTIKQPNDIECREPIIIDRTVPAPTVIDIAEYQRCKNILHGIGVASLLTMTAFLIYVAVKSC